MSGIPTATGTNTFTVTATDTNGCSGSRAYSVVVNSVPQVTTQPRSFTNVFGGMAMFSVEVSGTTPFSYQWQLNATNLPNGIIKTVAGNGTGTYSGDGGPATSASLAFPSGVAVDASGNLFFADSGNSRIRKVSPNGVITTVAGGGSNYFGDGGRGDQCQFWILLPAWQWTSAATCSLRTPNVAPQGERQRDYHARWRAAEPAIPATAAWRPMPALFPLPAWRWTPTATCSLRIAINSRIREVGTNGIITTVAGNGISGYSGDGGPATNASLYYPSGVAVDARGNLFIADSRTTAFARWAPMAIITTVAGNRTNGSPGDSGAATNAGLERALRRGSGHQRQPVHCGCGQRPHPRSGHQRYHHHGGGARHGGPTPAMGERRPMPALNDAVGVAVDASGNLFIADLGQSRIRKVGNTREPTLELNNLGAANAGSYRVVIANAIGSVTSSVAVLTVQLARPASFSGLSASQSSTYGTPGITLSGKLSASGPIYPAPGETIGVSINGNLQTTYVNDTNGDFSFTYGPSDIPARGTAYTITYSYAGDTFLSPATDASTTLTVSPVTLTVTANDATRAYGQPNPFFTDTLIGVTNSDDITATNTCSATAASPPGLYPIVPSLVDPDNRLGSYIVTMNDGTLTVTAAIGTVTLGNLSQTYDGTAKAASYATVPPGLAVNLTYNGSANAPTNAGSYTVAGIINDPNYLGGATNTLVIAKPGGTVALSNLLQTYDGTAKSVSATTTPPGLMVNLTYNGSATAPTNGGSSAHLSGVYDHPNYQGSATSTLVVGEAKRHRGARQPEPDLRRGGQDGFGHNRAAGSGRHLHLQWFGQRADRCRQLHCRGNDQRWKLPGERDEYAGRQPGRRNGNCEQYHARLRPGQSGVYRRNHRAQERG